MEAEFVNARLCFKNWQHWSSTKISSIWHLSVGGLRVGPVPSTGAYGAMSLLLLILGDPDNWIISHMKLKQSVITPKQLVIKV